MRVRLSFLFSLLFISVLAQDCPPNLNAKRYYYTHVYAKCETEPLPEAPQIPQNCTVSSLPCENLCDKTPGCLAVHFNTVADHDQIGNVSRCVLTGRSTEIGRAQV